MTLKEAAETLNFSVPELFREAFNRDRGLLWGLRPPEELADLYQRGWCDPPPYLKAYLRRMFKT